MAAEAVLKHGPRTRAPPVHERPERRPEDAERVARTVLWRVHEERRPIHHVGGGTHERWAIHPVGGGTEDKCPCARDVLVPRHGFMEREALPTAEVTQCMFPCVREMGGISRW